MSLADTWHRLVPHSAGLRIEAWAPGREHCLAEAVAGLVDSFLGRPLPRPEVGVEWDLPADREENMLVRLLEEAIYQIDVFGRAPVAATVEATSSGLHVRFDMADLEHTEPCGPAPKAVLLHLLRFAPDTHGWNCAVTIDV
ncbi:archease [Nocardia pseudobrasiliensis]|uniref:SHS2 domain-containing protein n=1 Tax=Nocardia pseudobrasiliensis TaxID=45979 RepID=A0A370HPF5_9NOCA|nr:archease [Nocardia pseudobrasiliensis]RDI60453.1 SHS2 domain-containing protein [Nocardia pseudobrasiliensis]